jgi:hypothetical protein
MLGNVAHQITLAVRSESRFEAAELLMLKHRMASTLKFSRVLAEDT